jgi:hypothetical protein
LMYTAWNIWKERNWRVLEGKTLQPNQVLVFDSGGHQLTYGQFDASTIPGGPFHVTLSLLHIFRIIQLSYKRKVSKKFRVEKLKLLGKYFWQQSITGALWWCLLLGWLIVLRFR